MLETDYRHLSKPGPPSCKSKSRRLEIEALHARCGVYTKPEIAARILDAVGWRPSSRLFRYRLLEPSAGNGEFLVEAARRLIFACQKHGLKPTKLLLQHSISAFEIHPREAERARKRVEKELVELGLRLRTASSLAASWVITGDYLLAPEITSNFTHAVGNPPYVRWSKIPTGLEAKYRKALPRAMVGGDIFLPFLDRALTSLVAGGRCGFLCSDRWRYTAFAQAFRVQMASTT